MANIKGSILLLEAAGFIKEKLPIQDAEEEFYVFPADGDIEVLKVLLIECFSICSFHEFMGPKNYISS